MAANLERRIERLEQTAPDRAPQVNFTGLTREERAEVREVLEAIGAGRMTTEEGRAWLAQTPILDRHRGPSAVTRQPNS